MEGDVGGDMDEAGGRPGLRVLPRRRVEPVSRRAADAADGPLRVVLVEPDPELLAAERATVSELPGFVAAGEATSLDGGVREVMKARPAIVVIGLEPAEAGLALAERIAEIFPDATLVLSGDEGSAELVKRAMRAGVREFLGRPPIGGELGAALRRAERHRLEARAPRRRVAGELVAVFSSKGGLGATFVATNLAVLLAGAAETGAVVADLNLELGDVATFLNLKPQHSILDLMVEQGGLDASLVESTLTPHPSGLRLLAQPEDAADADRVSAGSAGEVLTRLKTMFDWVVVDAPRRFDERTLEALDLADQILLLVAIDLPSIRNGRRCLEVFARLGYASRVKLVVNRHRPSRAAERLERSFGVPVAWRIPDDYSTAISSINAGVPVAEVGPETDLARALRGLAGILAGQTEDARAAAGAPARARAGILRRFLFS